MVRVFIVIASLFFATPLWASTVVPLQFFTFTQMKMPEQDVFIQDSDTKEVIRIQADAATPELLNEKVYSAAAAPAHDFFKTGASPLGPFAKGKPLGLTLGGWLAASGSGTYTMDGGKVDLSLTFEKLVPRGVYSVWCSRLTFPPNAPLTITPCGLPDGSTNTFQSDASGNGTIHIVLPSPLAESSKETVTAILVTYHSDSNSHGDSLGEFGKTTHVQLLSLIPAKEEAPPLPVVPKSGYEKPIPWELVGFVTVAVAIGAWWIWKNHTNERVDI